MNQKKLIAIVILLATLVLAGIAGFAAFNLYQINQEPTTTVSPKQTVKEPEVVVEEDPEVYQAGQYPCQLTFKVSRIFESPSPIPSPSPSVTPSPIPSPPPPSPNPECWEQCNSSSDCPSGLTCLTVQGTARCVNPSCPEESDCICPPPPAPESPITHFYATSPSPIPVVPEAELPVSGTSLPTIILGVGGLLLVVLGFLL